MSLLLALVMISFVISAVTIIPFINLLYKLKFQRLKQTTKDAFGKRTPIFDKFHQDKAGTPVGGGLLIISVVTYLFMLILPILDTLGYNITHVYPLNDEINIILFTFISFGLLGLYDDVMKFFHVKRTKFFGLRLRHKFIIQWILALIVASLMYFNLHIDIFYIPFIGVLHLSYVYIPFAAGIIVMFANAVNITDGLDGLASGVLLITLFAFWLLSSSILDTPLSIFLALWIGSLTAFLYFNIFPARIFLGDVGALSFGATFAVIGLLLGKIMALMVIGGIFIAELLSSFLQLSHKKVTKRKLFPVAPIHLWLQLKGWAEPKIVQRAWLATIMLTIFGIWLAIV